MDENEVIPVPAPSPGSSKAMLNGIEARREARRKKILENAKDRLEKLNGNVMDGSENIDDLPSSEQAKFSDPEIETELEFGPKFSPQTPVSTPVFPFEMEFGGSQNIGAETLFAQWENALKQEQRNTSPQQQNQFHETNSQQVNSKLARILKSKIHLVLISLSTYFACLNENFNKFSIFLPLLIWELTETFILKANDNQGSILFDILFMFSGLKPTVANSLKKLLTILNNIFKDVAVFVFFFVIYHLTFIFCIK